MKCSTKIVTQLQKDCKPQETIMVGTTLQNMLSAYEGVCKYIIHYFKFPSQNMFLCFGLTICSRYDTFSII